jgi:hypothetical protein
VDLTVGAPRLDPRIVARTIDDIPKYVNNGHDELYENDITRKPDKCMLSDSEREKPHSIPCRRATWLGLWKNTLIQKKFEK